MDNKKLALDILNAWHRVEFFQIYSLPKKEDEELQPRNIFSHELVNNNDSVLPWFNLEQLDKFGLDPQKKTLYTLNLCLFDKSVLLNLINDQMPQSKENCSDESSITEIEQRFDHEGESCFAQIKVNEYGKVISDSLTISTLPWALGHLLNKELSIISYAEFRRSYQELKEKIERLFVNNGSTVTANTINSLVKLIYQWAKLDISTFFSEKKNIDNINIPHVRISYYQFKYKKENQEMKDIEKEIVKGKEIKEESKESKEIEEIEEESDESIPILNSFYIEDIERAINSVTRETAGPGLLRYLSQEGQHYVDLYSDEALTLIADQLNPQYTPEGRWPSAPDYNLSLMQQFAVNTSFKELINDGLLSVNGPPGTGKTTLLRDIIAQNIVERAKVLALLDHASDGIDADGWLIEALTGFEMVVASSNNAAVENISKELPQNNAIHESYLQECCYFRPVANQLAATKRKQKLQPINDKDKQCWGLISAVMGANAKRKEFKQRFLFDTHYDEVPQERPESEDFLNLRDHFKYVKTVSFDQAKRDFLNKLADFKKERDQQTHFIALEKTLQEDEETLVKLSQAQKSHQFDYEQKQIEKKKYETQIIFLSDDINIIEMRLEALRLQSPNFLSRLFNTKKNQLFNEKLASILSESVYLKEQLSLNTKQLVRLTELLSNIETKLIKQQDKIKVTQQEIKIKKQQWEQLKNKFDKITIPELNASIRDVKLQKNAYWQDKSINDKRSKVFIAAMKLHQAWLYEIRKNASVKKILFTLSDFFNSPIKGAENKKYWQFIFMFVPVISTTFASLGRMFSELNEGSIGWLMIDEAGQAIPQAAVGGLLRAKRTIVVGDPLQIEPVFTSPPHLVNYLMQQSLGDLAEQWQPNKCSVQTLADRVNPYGCTLTVQEQEKWIGIPLWVHRRCLNPMFSIANKIAYQNRMIHGNYSSSEEVPTELHPQLGKNSWFIATGKCSYRQYYSQLGEELVRILEKVVSNGGRLKDIYVISPFKAVKNELKKYIQENKALFEKDKYIKTFIKNNIGTVHTFQGKENNTVIFILGCDRENEGGAVWATSKPNLVNVAVTRAKKHVFVVGDPAIWADKPYFSDCIESLERVPDNLI